jgi:23S rRNA (adenine2030-N6)-methyltransferase
VNYRHAFHAGNFADVVKHAALAYLLDLMATKPKPFMVLDTHAGIGAYDLVSVEAFKTLEARDGIARLWARRDDADCPAILKPYLAAVAAANPDRSDILIYPGSPMITRRALGPDDRLVLIERHPADAQTLARRFAGDSQTRVEDADGWVAVKAKLPPDERRGLVLIDPPFEELGEHRRLVQALVDGHRRFATGVFILWYPIKDEAATSAFHRDLTDTGIPKMLRLEVRIARPGAVPGLHGTGLIIVNPTWPFAENFAPVLNYLKTLLAQGPGASARMDWLVD